VKIVDSVKIFDFAIALDGYKVYNSNSGFWINVFGAAYLATPNMWFFDFS